MNKQDVHDLYVANIELLYRLLPCEQLEDIQEDIDDVEYQLSRLDELWEKAGEKDISNVRYFGKDLDASPI